MPTTSAALWRLDGRLLPALAATRRPTPTWSTRRSTLDSAYGPTPRAASAAPLPDWMKLYAQLDLETGWASPQVLTPDARLKFEEARPEPNPSNATPGAAPALDALRQLPTRPRSPTPPSPAGRRPPCSPTAPPVADAPPWPG
ncbi:MAG: hypothetical protein U0804_10520 [Gemmataceae bacterium]